MDITLCPDVTMFNNLNSDSAIFKTLQKTLTNEKYKSSLTRISDGKTIDFLPYELYQLYQDFLKAILSIIERKIAEAEWIQTLNSASTTTYINTDETENPFRKSQKP
ncbi:MAG: hypothetical protein ACOCNL_10870 [Acetivibrio ethanolgignens]